METVYLNGTPVHTYGMVPAPGDKAPCFDLVSKDLTEVRCADYRGKRIVLNIFPSIDTGVCAASVRHFNADAASLDNTVVICASMDLPFAAARFCAAEGIDNCIVASAFRSPAFGQNYGVQMVDGPLAGLFARAVVVIGTDGTVLYSQLVDEITHEPDYEAAIKALK